MGWKAGVNPMLVAECEVSADGGTGSAPIWRTWDSARFGKSADSLPGKSSDDV